MVQDGHNPVNENIKIYSTKKERKTHTTEFNSKYFVYLFDTCDKFVQKKKFS